MGINRNAIRLIVIILVVILGFFVLTRLAYTPAKPQGTETYLLINKSKINIEKAISNQEKTRGLSYRNSLSQDTGMLFVYETPQKYTFWMHEMRFPLDFIWIENNSVADLHENIPHPALTNNIPETVTPKVPVRYILEVNGGWIKKHNIHVGDPVIFHNV